ncbi:MULTISPECIES: FHA domain-containing protein [unclassified Salinibacterium]|uniref:FHA domain-containing protein n=1 Tax=unclassified Salinibacterium TaxID=2632331 RepID=UPI0018CCB784|nr:MULTISPECIES: FHA domain-containing protein [unclassified Salinibacterium]MBH0053686.1 FHA domain-containing protein [Salinibacterium sp. SWN139]MBH0082959.1 FHA domain-containing protein [Salinibacterium sp. SWN167]
MVTKYLCEPAADAAWSAVVGEQLIILVDSSDSALIERLWTNRIAGAQAAVEVLSARGLSATPSFALVEWTADDTTSAGARAIVRGAASVVFSTATGSHTVSGTRVSTWAEHHFDDVRDCVIAIDGRAAGRSDETRHEVFLPIFAGVVKTMSVHSSRSSSRSTATPASLESPRLTPSAPELADALPPAAAVSEATMVDRPDQFSDIPPGVSAASAARKGDTAVDDAQGYDFLFGETVMRNVSEAASGNENDVSAENADVAPPPAPEAGSEFLGAEQPAAEGDHDGLTIMTADLASLRASQPKPSTVSDSPPNQPTLYLDLSTGAREVLSQPILVGRAPTVAKVSSGALPRLVTIPGDKDISRNHVQIVVEGGTVVVTDLHSRNGTHVTLPGRASQRLRAGEPTAVIIGTVIDLGGDVTLTVSEGA